MRNPRFFNMVLIALVCGCSGEATPPAEPAAEVAPGVPKEFATPDEPDESVSPGAGEETQDPICGLAVDPASALTVDIEGQTFQFCSERCQASFREDPRGKGEAYFDKLCNCPEKAPDCGCDHCTSGWFGPCQCGH